MMHFVLPPPPKRQLFPCSALVAVCFLLSTCISTVAYAQSFLRKDSKGEQPIQTYSELVASGRYADAAALVDAAFGRRAKQKEEKGEVHNRSLQLYLMKASALQWADSGDALDSYDIAEDAIKNYETRVLGAGALEFLGAAFAGSGARSYRPRASDGVLVNTFKAELFLQGGRLEDARVELNRSDERTRRMVEALQKEIELAKREAEKKNKESSNQVDSIMSEHYPDIAAWDVYEDFVNPYSVYLHAVFFFAASEAASDLDKSIESMKRLAGMYPDSAHLAEQLRLFERVASGNQKRKDLPDQVWVVCSDGLGPEIGIKRVQPKYEVAGGLVTIGAKKTNRRGEEELLPLPVVQVNPAAFDGCGVAVDGKPAIRASEIASMDRIFLTEFKKRLPTEISQSISAYALSGNAIAGAWKKLRTDLGARDDGLGNKLDSSLETRVWQGLPKKWYAARVDRPASGHLTVLGADGTKVVSIDVPASRMALVHVRTPSRNAIPAVSVSILAGH